MSDSYHTDEFEDYLKEQVNDHRMYPSDSVWKNIHKKIHTPKKWPALSVFTVLIISALVIGTILNKPIPDTATANFTFTLQNQINQTKSKKDEAAINAEPFTDEHYAADQLTSHTIANAVEKLKNDESIALQLEKNVSHIAINNTVSAPPTIYTTGTITTSTQKQNTDTKNLAIADINQSNTTISLTNFNQYLFNITSRLKSILNSDAGNNNTDKGGVAFFLSKNHELNYDDLDFNMQQSNSDIKTSALERLGKSSSKFDFRFYITPSVSYRRLNEVTAEKTSSSAPASFAALESSYKVNPSQAINQRPAIGYETGFGLGYAMNKRFSLTGGIQFNISQYKIDAFLYKSEPTIVTLDEGKFASTINTVSSLRSIPGSKPLTIKNRYYQIGLPLGVDWKAWSNATFTWGLAGSLQPTYTFDKQPLIITSNFKNYADGTPYVRNWNLNASIETYFGYTTGSYRWQLGPQFRYQMLPSLVDKYPNKEYLLNYGLKFGVVKQLK